MIDARLDTTGLQPRLVLQGPWTIAQAAQGRERLLALPLDAVCGTLAIDLGGLREIDTAGVQLMLALSRRLRERGLTADVSGVPVNVQRVARVLGAADDEHCFGWSLTSDLESAR